MKVFIYKLLDPRNNRIRYVGRTVNPSRRSKEHVRPSVCRKYHCKNWIMKLREIGLKPAMEILEESDEHNWRNSEQWWIAHFRNIKEPLTNLNDGGEGNIGHKMPESVKAALLKANLGRVITMEHRAKLSAATKGIPKSAETIAKMTGKKFSKERLIAHSQRSKGRKFSATARKNMSESKIAFLEANPGFMKILCNNPEYRQRLSLRMNGHIISEETKLKISRTLQGRKQSPETIAKRVAAIFITVEKRKNAAT